MKTRRKAGVNLFSVVGAALAVVMAAAAATWPRSTPRQRALPAQTAAHTSATVGRAPRAALPVYVRGIRPDLFCPVQPTPVTAPPRTEIPAPPPVTTPPPPPDPLADYTYSGTISMGDTRLALIENRKTREGTYVAVGDAFEGGTVTSFDGQTLSIRMGAKPQSMALNTDYKLIPFDKSASYLTAAPGAASGAPGAPGSPGTPGAPATPGVPGGTGFMGGRFRGGASGFPGGAMPMRIGGPGAPANVTFGAGGGAANIILSAPAGTSASQTIEATVDVQAGTATKR